MASKQEEKRIDDVLYHFGVHHTDIADHPMREHLVKLVDKAYDRGYAAAVADALDDGNFGGK